MDVDRIEGALADLGAEDRALLELSLIRSVADGDIADLLGVGPDHVRHRREDALAQLAAEVGASSGEEVGRLVHEMRALPTTRWRAPVASEPSEAEHPGRRRAVLAAAGGLVIALTVGLVLALAGGDEGDSGGDARATEGGRPAALAAPAGGDGSGTARLTGDRLLLTVDGLPDPGRGGYVVWLYNSVFESRPLTRPRSEGSFRLETRLPDGWERFRFIDVSREPADSNRNHSGQSVLRVPLSALR